MPKPWDMTPEELLAEAERLRPSWQAADKEAAHLFLRQLSEDPDDEFVCDLDDMDN